MKTFQQATEIVSRRIKNHEAEHLLCWSDDLKLSIFAAHMTASAIHTIQLIVTEEQDPIAAVLNQTLISICIGIAIGIEMEKPAGD